MTDNLDRDVTRAHRAAALLSDSLLTEAFDKLRADYLTAWEGTTARDTDARERLWQAVQIVGKVKTHLQAVVNNGTLAQREIDDLAGKKPKRFGIV